MRVRIFFKNESIFANFLNFLFITCLVDYFRVSFSIRNHPVIPKMVVFSSAARRPVKVADKTLIAFFPPWSELHDHVISDEYLCK